MLLRAARAARAAGCRSFGGGATVHHFCLFCFFFFFCHSHLAASPTVTCGPVVTVVSEMTMHGLLKELISPTMARTRRYLMTRHRTNEWLNHARRFGHVCDIVLRGIAQVRWSVDPKVGGSEGQFIGLFMITSLLM